MVCWKRGSLVQVWNCRGSSGLVHVSEVVEEVA